jgi:predicted nucleic acid-binding protein
VAAADRDDRDHMRCLAVLQRSDLHLAFPTMVIAEASYLINRILGPIKEATFLRGLRNEDIQAPEPEDWPRIAELVEKFADFPLGGTDASVIALAERLETDVVITLDRRHFVAVQPRHVTALRVLPD